MTALDDSIIEEGEVGQAIDSLEEMAVHFRDDPPQRVNGTANPVPECNLTSLTSVNLSEEYYQYLSNSATLHALTTKTLQPVLYKEDHFFGIMIDTGCSFASTGVEAQFKTYCNYTGTKPEIDDSRSSPVRFGKGSTISRGTARIFIPF